MLPGSILATKDTSEPARVGRLVMISKKIFGNMILPISYVGGKEILECNPATDTWAQKMDFGVAAFFPVGFTIGNKAYVGTGFDAGYTKEFWEYDPSIDKWTRKADFGGSARLRAVGF